MRITLGMRHDQMKANIMQSAEDMMRAENVAATGKRIHVPSDDIPGTGRVLMLRSALADINQYSRNAEMASAQLGSASAALNTVVNRMQEVRRLAIQAGNAGLTDEARAGIASQLDRISQEMVSAANTQHLGKYIFSGNLSNVEPIVANASGTPPYNYAGDQNQFTVQVGPGIYSATTVTGDTVFNMNGSAIPGTEDVFSAIKSLRDMVVAGDTSGISDQLKVVDANLSNVISAQSQVGARLSRVEASKSALEDSQVRLKELLSKTEDADTAEAIIDMQSKQNVYQAALSTAGRVLQTTLVDILK